jgi:DNA-binding transcriptional LysR family regulator
MVIKQGLTVSPEQAEAFVMRRMSLRQLRVLKALADAGSLSAAADLLHVTQPAISKTLSEIERALGQTLTARRGRNIRLTLVAQRLVEMVERINAMLRRGGEEVASLVRGTSGELLIGATNAALTELVCDALARVKVQHPLLAISVRTHALSSMFEDLRAGRLDLVIARQVDDAPSDLDSEMLLPTREVVALSATHPLAGQRKISWETLNDQAWIWPVPGTRSRARRDAFWQKLGLPLPTNVLQIDDLMLTMGMLRRSPLVTIMPLHIAQAAARDGIVKMLPLSVDLGLGDLCIWQLRDLSPPPVQHFKSALHAASAAANQA